MGENGITSVRAKFAPPPPYRRSGKIIISRYELFLKEGSNYQKVSDQCDELLNRKVGKEVQYTSYNFELTEKVIEACEIDGDDYYNKMENGKTVKVGK